MIEALLYVMFVKCIQRVVNCDNRIGSRDGSIHVDPKSVNGSYQNPDMWNSPSTFDNTFCW